MQRLSSDLQQFFLVKNYLLTCVHNDTDNADDANDYNRVIGIALLKAFSCAKNMLLVEGLINNDTGIIVTDPQEWLVQVAYFISGRDTLKETVLYQMMLQPTRKSYKVHVT